MLCRVIYDFNAEDGWVERAEGSFKRSLINTQGRSVVEASTLKLRRVTGLAKASTIIESLARNAQSKLVTDTGAKITHWREAFDALIHADAEGKDTRLFADLLKELLAADDNAANEYLSFIVDLEAAKKIGESQALVLWSDFVELGSIASQRAIMDLIENPAADEQIRVRALIYAARLPQPSDETLDRMWAIRRAYRGKEGELNALLDNSSLLQIGTMVSNRRVMKVDDSVHVLRICEEANQVIEAHDRVVALEALGNAVHSAALATLERYTLDQSLEVRQAALVSIGCFPQDQKLPIVERVYPQIHDPQSRAAAVEALGAGSLNSDLGERTTEWAMAQIGGETSPLVQVQLVKVLAHALP
ncbi:MAG: hypothetical protein KDB07_10135, partial [Planctomycetes bacterium]|nr:hypothetical protein [Planctomycetota bacterium]